ncbi:hypothetical protein [Nocardioides sp. J54]|nr:hypothetical protein [Nocardioides sp. J54]
MQDLTDRLDAELGRAPEPTFDIADTLAAGHRAVRRRRAALGAAGLAAALVVGALVTTATGGLARDVQDAAPTWADQPREVTWPVEDAAFPVRHRDGQWEVNPEATVLHEDRRSGAVLWELEVHGQHVYVRGDRTGSWTLAPVGVASPPLRAWATDPAMMPPAAPRVPVVPGWDDRDEPLLVVDGRLRIHPDAEVVRNSTFTASNGAQGRLVHLEVGNECHRGSCAGMQGWYVLVDAELNVTLQALPFNGVTAEEWAEYVLTLPYDVERADGAR